MIQRPPGMGGFTFAVLASLRAVQLKRGCTPRVDGIHKGTVIAQFEVAQGLVKELLVATGDAAAPGAPVEPVLLEEALLVTT